MRATDNFTYVIEKIFDPQDIFLFIQNHANLSDYEMYQTFNMGMDYALFISKKDVERRKRLLKNRTFLKVLMQANSKW